MAIPPVASLPMYDWPEVQWAHDVLWAAIRDRLREAGITAPEELDRARPLRDLWLDPGLVLSQTCGWPYATRLKDRVQLVATPAYAVEGCDGPFYSSAIIARREQGLGGLQSLDGLRAAFNGRDSLSGYVALLAALSQAGVNRSALGWVETGSHRASLRALAARDADFAAIDSVCWALARRHEPETTAELVVLAWTPLRPALPLISSAGRSEAEVQIIRAAVAGALSAPETILARSALNLHNAAVLQPDDYAGIAALLDVS